MRSLLLNMLNCSWNRKFYLKMKGVKKVDENIFITFIIFNYYLIKKIQPISTVNRFC